MRPWGGRASSECVGGELVAFTELVMQSVDISEVRMGLGRYLRLEGVALGRA